MSNLPQVIFGPEIWSLQSEGGISRYFQMLIKGLSQKGISGQILTMSNSNSRLKELDVENLQFRRLKKSRNSFGEISKILTNEIGGSVYHPTYYSKDLVKIRAAKTKVVLTVFDMISELFPEKKPRFRKFIDEKRVSVNAADHILSISEQTKKDLINIYEVPEDKITVTYLGSNLHLLPKVECVATTEKEFILYVGKRGGYKNFSNFVNAYSRSRTLRNNFQIIAVGGGNFSSTELSLFLELGITERVVHVNVSDEELAMLYREAACLVYPSLYEGFGLPLVEAMSLNCLVVASSCGSIPEICKDAAEYFNPSDIESIEHALTGALGDPQRASQKRKNGLLIAKSLTWDKTTLDTIGVYKRLGRQ